jgi:hypothetical protein
VFASISIIVVTSLTNWGATLLKSSRQLTLREQAFQVAEAGIDYYRWHLAHNPTDFTDGTNGEPPYIHEFRNADGELIGKFHLTITPPVVGSTVVKIKSKGTVEVDPDVSRTIEATLAIPSVAKYAVVANSQITFGEGTEIYGPVHSNDGIRLDGVAYNVVTSAVSQYTDPENNLGGLRFGVYTTVSPEDPQPPSAVPNRPDVFVAGRQFPVPAVDFSGFTAEMSQLKTDAQTSGRYFGPSGGQGYHIVLKTNDTFDIYKVTSLKNAVKNCQNDSGNESNWGTWSIQAEQFLQNYAIPANGIIFAEDHVWVDGQIDTARVTVAAGKFPDNSGNRKNITVNNDILYTNYDSRDIVGLFAQGDVNTGLYSEDNLRMDAAIISQNGRIGRPYYSQNCGDNYLRNTITLYGMIASNGRYGFAYTDGTGYINRNIIYDNNLLYAPPPGFPLTGSQYQTISWEEVEE